MKTGIELIAIERQEQIIKHGYDANHDFTHEGEYDADDEFPGNFHAPLISAALAFLNVDGERDVNESERNGDEFDDPNPNVPELMIPYKWPFKNEEWKGGNKTKIERLVIAGALIAAEIDRLQS